MVVMRTGVALIEEMEVGLKLRQTMSSTRQQNKSWEGAAHACFILSVLACT